MLLPQVVDAVDIPVIAAGGFFDGRGLVAALAYGAAGIAMGTRFLLTSDSTVPDAVKARYLAASVKDVTVTTRVDGLPHRMLRTRAGRGPGEARAGSPRWRARCGTRRRSGSISGLSWRRLLRDGRAMRHGKDLTWARPLLAANTPDAAASRRWSTAARTLGVMASGQVAGLIADLPSCAELVDAGDGGGGRGAGSPAGAECSAGGAGLAAGV